MTKGDKKICLNKADSELYVICDVQNSGGPIRTVESIQLSRVRAAEHSLRDDPDGDRIPLWTKARRSLRRADERDPVCDRLADLSGNRTVHRMKQE